MTFMLKLLVALLEGYREWTESLGADREWIIQAKQAELHMSLSVEVARYNGFLVPFRNDLLIVLASNTEPALIHVLRRVLAGKSPVPVRVSMGCGETPAEALDNAFYNRGSCGASEVSLVAHVDINDITGVQRREGVYAAWDRVVTMLSALHTRLRDYGALVSYLGGDNIIVLLPPQRDPLLLLEDIVEEYDAKAGVGFARVARKAVKLATLCLDRVRSERRGPHVRFCLEPGLKTDTSLSVFEWETGGKL